MSNPGNVMDPRLLPSRLRKANGESMARVVAAAEALLERVQHERKLGNITGPVEEAMNLRIALATWKEEG